MKFMRVLLSLCWMSFSAPADAQEQGMRLTFPQSAIGMGPQEAPLSMKLRLAPQFLDAGLLIQLIERASRTSKMENAEADCDPSPLGELLGSVAPKGYQVLTPEQVLRLKPVRGKGELNEGGSNSSAPSEVKRKGPPLVI